MLGVSPTSHGFVSSFWGPPKWTVSLLISHEAQPKRSTRKNDARLKMEVKGLNHGLGLSSSKSAAGSCHGGWGGREGRGGEPKNTLIWPLLRPYLGIIWAPSPSPPSLPSPHNPGQEEELVIEVGDLLLFEGRLAHRTGGRSGQGKLHLSSAQVQSALSSFENLR